MKTLTETDYQLLVKEVYMSLMDSPLLDMEDMAEAENKAKETVNSWMIKANIEIEK